MTPDPKWLEILKASGWQTTALAAAAGVFLLLPRLGLLPQPEPLVTSLAALAFLVCAFLALASVGHAAAELFRPRTWFVYWVNQRRLRRAVREYIPFMTEQEKKIIAYLLARNQKTITADQGGGFANTLISRGILILAVQSGQIFDPDDVPFIVPDCVWDELTTQKEQFPYTPQVERDGVEPHPWRVPWMAR